MNIYRILQTYLDKETRKRKKLRILAVLGILASVLTNAMLTSPADTLTGVLVCGQEEHEHAPECYQVFSASVDCLENTQEQHLHEENCYDAENKLICDKEEFVIIHTHDEECCDKDGNLICHLPETEEHEHTEECYDQDHNLICGKREIKVHPEHTEECYETDPETGEKKLICTYPIAIQHQHTGSCHDSIESVLVCTQKEHVHTDDCYEREVAEETGNDPETAAVDDEITAETPEVTEDSTEVIAVSDEEPEPAEENPGVMAESEIKEEPVQESAEENQEETPVKESDDEPAEETPAEEVTPEKTPSELAEENTETAAEDVKETPAEEKQEETPSKEPEDTAEIIAVSDEEPSETVSMPAVSFENTDTKINVFVSAEEGCFPEGTEMLVKPVSAEKVMSSVETAVGTNIVSVQAVDISFWHSNVEIEPAKPISVLMRPKEPIQAEMTSVVHVADEGEATVVQEQEGVQEEVLFDTPAFSVYALVGTTIEKTVLASDGNNYHINVTYGPETGIPSDADLYIEEITEGSSVNGISYEQYVASTESALGWNSVGYIRLFDISIVDKGHHETKYQPAEGTSVSVKIELADKDTGEKAETNTQVVHFADGSTSGDIVSAAAEGQTVSFEAGGFSAYAIVEGPSAVMVGWEKVTSIAELISMGSQGVYIGHPDGYYYGNTLINENRRIGIFKTKPAQPTPGGTAAAKYYFEAVEGTDNQVYAYCYAADGVTKQYVYNGGNNSLSFTDEAGRTAFTITQNSNGTFKLNNGAWYWNMQGGGSGKRFCSYNVATDANNNVDFWYYSDLPGDPYNLDGTSYGLMNWTGGNSGRAMMSSSSQENSLDVKALTVMTEKDNDEDKLFVPSDSEISKWTFHWIANDEYYMTTTVDGSTYYLQMDSSGLRLVESVDDASQIKVVPGSGNNAGQICLKSGSTTLTYSGNAENGFTVIGSAGSEWLYLVHDAEVTEDYYMTYSAQKVSISNVPNGERVIVYTRVWNEDDKRYEFYAVNSDGSLVRVYESGDSIQWNGAQLNTLLWDFTEYYWEDTQEPNYYYELYNEYSEKFIAPQQTNGQILSDDPIGINLNGRRNKRYYSSILAWDDDHYSYTGLKVENGQIVSCPKSEAMDFYFAAMEDIPTDDTLNTVPTVDNVQYGITMRMINFDSNKDQNLLLSGSENGGDTMLGTSQKCVKGLLSTNLDENGYPTAVRTGDYLGTLYSGADEVNKLFIQSTYNASGYFEYDSCQNFASLNTATNEFKVYKELGTYDGGSYPTRKHGQFFPYNDIEPGVFAVINGKNLYSATAEPLPDSDPRKNEHLYLIKNVDPHFAMELSASFTQTLNGKDAWGHDIIYEFTGDDDFWLYVDGELVIDLGGTHSAIPGFVNFSTGIVTQRGANGTNYTTTLYDIFISNYKARGMSESEAITKAQEKFKLNDEGNWVFKEYTSHTMKIFFMERGAGASNLHMRFNLASVRPGHVNLSKELAGIDSTESVMAEFPYQIYYKTSVDGEEKLLTQDAGDNLNIKVFYLDTETPVTYRDSITVGGITYPSVFMLKPGETADIEIPDDAISYRIVECGINTDIYTTASVKETGCIPIHKDGYMENRYDYSIDLAETKDRPRVTYINTVDPSAVRDMTITKKLYDETGETEIPAEDDPTSFTFRLYLGTEFDENPELANMYAYYVKDPGGHYCRWDASLKSFVSTEYTVFDDIPDKESVTFHTSINGSISKIKSGYTVELHNVLADTKYRVEERRSEIPDGYSFQRYEENGLTVAAPVEKNGTPGVEGTVAFNTDPAVTVRNLKGWGLRVNKTWADEDYMSEREPTYFAVFIQRNDPHGHGDGHVELVEDSVYQLPYDSDPQTLYWYFDRLENGTAIDQYIIREVRLTGGPYEVDEDGKVINVPAHSVHSIHDGGNLQLSGKQKGETEPSEFHYTVEYEEGSISAGSNVRVDTCTNNRQGILLKKTEWDETTPLAGTVFELKDENNNLVGTFTSDEEGEITTAFLRLGIDYTLTETAAPQGWHGLQEPMTITQTANHQIEVSGVDESFYEIENVHGQMTITIKNQPYTFQAVKKDAAGNTPISGVVFALHKQKTVGGSTSIDLNPMPGYEELVTDENGIIPQLDNTLPAGTYELREKSTLDGYALLESHTQFTVSPTGEITLGSHPDGVSMERTAENGTVHFELTVLNYRRKTVRFKKIDISDLDSALEGAVFDLYEVTAEGETQTRVEPPLYTGLVSGDDGFLKDSNGHKNFELPVGIYHLVETDAPEGYVLKDRVVVVTVTADDVNYDEGTSISGGGSGKSYDPQTDVYTLKISNSTGAELPMTGGSGTAMIYILGLMLIVISGTCLLQRRNS